MSDTLFFVVVLAIIFHADITLIIRALIKRWSK